MKLIKELFKCLYILITTMFTFAFFLVIKEIQSSLIDVLSIALVVSFGFIYGFNILYEITKESLK